MSRRVDTSMFQRIEPHVPMADQRSSRRKALLGEQAAELSIEQIRQEIETAKTVAAEGQRKAKAAETVREIRQRGGTPQQIVDAVSAVDPAEGDRLRALYQAEADKTFDAVNKTPGETLFEGSTLSATPGGLNTDDGSDSVLRGTMTADIPAGEIAPVEVGHAPIERPGMMGPTKIRPITAREFSQMNAKEALAKMEEQSRLKREEAAEQSQNKINESNLTDFVDVPEIPELGIKAMRVRKEIADNLITQLGGLAKPKPPTGIAAEYEYAKQQGYKGSFEQYQNEDANRKRPAQSNPTLDAIRALNLENLSNASPGQVVFKNSGRPVGRELPETAAQRLEGLQTAIQQADVVEKALLKLANSGAVSGYVEENGVYWPVVQRNLTPEQVAAVSETNRLLSAYAQAVSGLAVSEQEIERLKRSAPSVKLTPEANKVIVGHFKRNAIAKRDNYLDVRGWKLKEAEADSGEVEELERGPDGKLRRKGVK